jgi:hypothetical protein
MSAAARCDLRLDTPRVLRDHATDEISQLAVGTRSSPLAGDASPVGATRPPVPSHDCGRFDDRQGGGPVSPYATHRDPKNAIDIAES